MACLEYFARFFSISPTWSIFCCWIKKIVLQGVYSRNFKELTSLPKMLFLRNLPLFFFKLFFHLSIYIWNPFKTSYISFLQSHAFNLPNLIQHSNIFYTITWEISISSNQPNHPNSNERNQTPCDYESRFVRYNMDKQK